MERIKKYYEMGVELAKKKNYDEARECFKKCIEVDLKYIPAYYQLLIDAIIREDYITYVNICNSLKRMGDFKASKNANYYLFMLQFIAGEAYNYHISLDDILLSAEENERNEVRKASYNKDFKQASDLMHGGNIRHSLDCDIEFLLELKIIVLAKNFYPKRKGNCFELLAIRDYNALWNLLNAKVLNKTASRQEKYLKKLCEAYIKISSDENYEFQLTPKGDVYHLIEGRNFRAALEESTRFNKRFNKAIEDNMLTTALDDICYLKTRVDREKSVKKEYIATGKYSKRVERFHHNLLVQRGAGILGFNPTEEELEQLRAYKNVLIMPIKDEEGNDRYAVIYKDDRYVGNLSQADKLYDEGEYHLAIKEYVKVLETTYDYPDDVYEKLADAYENIGVVRKALIYTRLAFNMTNDKNKAKEFEKRARQLKKAKDAANKKAKKDQKEKQNFNFSLNDYIQTFIMVNGYILENGVDIETAVIDLGITENTIDIIMLIYARECYRAHMGDTGDKLIKYVEQNAQKTEGLKKLIEQVKSMKRVDMNKPSSNEYNIPLNLKITSKTKQKN